MPTGRSMQAAAALFIGSWVVHTADHARRGVADTTEAVVWAGTFVGLLASVAITLIFAEHPVAPLVAAVTFPSIAIGVTASHLLPDWGALSDPILVDSVTDGWSIVAVVPEIIAAALLGAVAIRLLARNDFRARVDPALWR